MHRPRRAAVALCALLLLPAAEKPPYDPIEQYTERTVEGWRVLVNKRLLQDENRELCDRTLKLLGDHLYRITRVVPAGPLARLRKIPIWVELAHPRHPCMCYHPSADWLREHGMNPRKAGAVELSNARNFLTWTHDQPWMVLHVNGSRRHAYALTNPMEYFAEGTEAFFGTNNFYPFVRGELKQHDPRLFQLLEQVWEVRGPKSRPDAPAR